MTAGQPTADARSSVSIARATLVGLHGVRRDMQRDQRADVSLDQAVAALVRHWKEGPGIMTTDDSTQASPGAEQAPAAAPCEGCSGPCAGGQARVWAWIGAAFTVGLIALAVASGAYRSARRAPIAPNGAEA